METLLFKFKCQTTCGDTSLFQVNIETYEQKMRKNTFTSNHRVKIQFN